jgi:gamma-glutamylcyclotransferase (GGCT)/AIG2-like uncharacterized protein YtfP
MINVFVYGMLMKPGGIAAVLRGHRLAFGGGGHATPEPYEGGVLNGCVLTVDAMGLNRMDGAEGVNPRDPEKGYYRREKVTVSTPNGDMEAYVYVMNPTSRNMPPSRFYVDWIREGYRAYDHLEDEIDAAVLRATAGWELPTDDVRIEVV